MKNSKKTIRYGIGIFIAIVLIYFLVSFTSYESIKNTFLQTPFSLILVGFLLYVLMIVLKSAALKYVLCNKISIKSSLFINSAGLFFLNILPFRSGELSYVFLLKKKGIPGHLSISALYVLRICEFTAVFLTLFLTFLFVSVIL